MKRVIGLIVLCFILSACSQQLIEETKDILFESEIQPEAVEIPEIVKQKCNDDCVEVNGVVSYLLSYNYKTELFDCFCLNTAEEKIQNFSYDYEPGKEAELTGDEFYYIDDLHWTHMPITYYIVNEEECGSYEVNKIKRAFDEVENTTYSIISFKKIDKPADIDITCSFIEDCYERKIDIQHYGDYYTRTVYETICPHKGGIAGITNTKGRKILKATIEMIGLAGFAETAGKGASGFYIGSCGHPTTEIHEILHTLNYGHVNDENSIMYYQEDTIGYTVQEEGACIGKRKYIDQEIIEDLIEKYG
jgi:hypothetical protein